MSAQASWQCEEPTWVEEPELIDDHFVGKIESRCRIQAVVGNGLNYVAQYMLDFTMDNSEVIHEGPLNDALEGRPATYVDYTRDMSAQGYEIKGRADYRVASDEELLVELVTSKEIKATGMAQNFKGFSNRIEIAHLGDGEYEVVTHYTNSIQRLWFLPKATFLSEVTKRTEAEMKARVNEDLPILHDML